MRCQSLELKNKLRNGNQSDNKKQQNKERMMNYMDEALQFTEQVRKVMEL